MFQVQSDSGNVCSRVWDAQRNLQKARSSSLAVSLVETHTYMIYASIWLVDSNWAVFVAAGLGKQLEILSMGSYEKVTLTAFE